MSRRRERGHDAREAREAREAHEAAADPARGRARAAALWGALAVLALWGVSPFVPGMALWGTNALRYTAPTGWALWVAAAILAGLALSGRLDGALAALGRAFDGAPRAMGLALALVTALVVLALPDRVYYTGDFLFRRGLNEVELQQSTLAPQLMPLDRFLHLSLAPAVRDALGLTTVDTDRWIGALDAVLLALAAVWFVRALKARGFAGVALALALVFGGGLSIFTGYGKSFVEMAVLVVVIAATALECVARGRHAVPMALAACAYLALHRTGFVVLPAVVLALALAWRAHAKVGRVRRELLIAGVVLVGGVAWLGPRALSILRAYDASHHAPGALFAPLRVLDLANVVLLLAPLVPAAALALVARPRVGRAAEAAVLGTLALSFAVLAGGSFPQQGVVRDVDVFVPNALAWSCLAALILWSALDERRTAAVARIALVLCAVSAAGTLAWMTHQHDTERGFARVRAIVAGPPARPAAERSSSLDFLGAALFRLARFDEAAVAYRDATQASPNPRYFVQWGVAAMRAGQADDARIALREAVARNPSLVPAWRMLAALAVQAGDVNEADRALSSALALSPGDQQLEAQAAAIHARALAEADSAGARSERRVSAPASPR